MADVSKTLKIYENDNLPVGSLGSITWKAGDSTESAKFAPCCESIEIKNLGKNLLNIATIYVLNKYNILKGKFLYSD